MAGSRRGLSVRPPPPLILHVGGTVQKQLQVEEIAISKLKPFEKNPRSISPKGIEKLQKSIERFGFVNPILAQKGTGLIIAGHQRIRAAKAEGLKTVPVIWLDMTDTEAKAYNIADNRLQDEAVWENDLLAGLITELETEGFDLELTGLDVEEIKLLTIGPDFLPVPIDGQPKLDEKRKVICPSCGHEFTP